MLPEAVFRTEDLPVADRFDRWREQMADTHAPMDLSTDLTSDYHAHQRIIELGAVAIWPATFDPLVFRRTRKLIRQSDPETYHLSLLIHGEAGIAWERQEASYGPYDFHSNDSSRQYEIWTGQERIRSIGMEIPKNALPLPVHRSELVIGRRMSGRDGLGLLLTQFLTQVSADTGAYQPSDAARLGTVLTDLVGALFAQVLETDDTLPPETHRRTLVLRIKAFIQRHLHDPQLTLKTIAAAHHISISYLHRLFKDETDTVAAWIRRQRLEQARHELVTRTGPIHDIASRWGFREAADFSRAFRTAYGMAPSDYRRVNHS